MSTVEEMEQEVIQFIEEKESNTPWRRAQLMRLVNMGKMFMKGNITGDMYYQFLKYIKTHLFFTAPEVITHRLADFLNRYPGFAITGSAHFMDSLIRVEHYGTNARRVREFTEGAFGPRPDRPGEPMNRQQAEFITGMVISEMVELMQTVIEPGEDVIEVVRKLCDRDYNANYVKPTDKVGLVAEQTDAMTDASYYMYDMGSRMGVNLDRVFNVVHAANMAKRDPETGEFRKREDGKILKPEGWEEPDVRAEIETQMREGAWGQ